MDPSKPFKLILLLFIIWRIYLLVFTYTGSIVFSKVANGGIGAIGQGHEFNFWASWAQWDGGHYFNISKNGYFGPNEYAFFPLYPLVVKTGSLLLFGNNLLSGLLIANIAYIGFLYTFFRLVNLKFSQKIATASLLTVITFPTSYFGVALYSESLFLLLTALTFLLLENKKPYLAAIVILLASLTRFVGIFLVVPLISFCLKSADFKFRKINLPFLSIPISLSGISLYCFYLYLKFKDPIYFFTVQSTWHRSIVNPLLTIWGYFVNNLTTKPFIDYLDITSTIAFLLILIWGFKKIPISWTLFSLLVVFAPTSSGTLTSIPRYVLASLPAFILFGMFLQNRKILSIFVWTSFFLLQLYLAIRFVNGYWTA